MPHAALWVVQHQARSSNQGSRHGFNAARGFVGGAAESGIGKMSRQFRFNAARGFVGGAALRL